MHPTELFLITDPKKTGLDLHPMQTGALGVPVSVK